MAKLSAAIMVSVLVILALTFLLIQMDLVRAETLRFLPPLIALTIAVEIGVAVLRKKRK
ncbi:hypothetical protein [Paraburkholderia rhynchosiae]|uniref:Uncharacterized protein n=1 Tax=Paraburkholderia rhynchosiae TaxID=487049 RepID=A0A6J5CUX9_9BURK|nr:hypothetical protein [Paraburkholderia rhynchosiae]CAB3744641.1 hypothetical protein LMG27174_07218 [Paraburkholderia rhynchosiae]